jgi:hypothetical protein
VGAHGRGSYPPAALAGAALPRVDSAEWQPRRR